MCRSAYLPIVRYCEVCCCLHIKCSVYIYFNTLVHSGPSKSKGLMVISTTGILLYAKLSPLYNVLWEWLCCCLQVNYIIYDRHIHT